MPTPRRWDHRARSREPGRVPIGDQGRCGTRALAQPRAPSETCAHTPPAVLTLLNKGASSDHPDPLPKHHALRCRKLGEEALAEKASS